MRKNARTRMPGMPSSSQPTRQPPPATPLLLDQETTRRPTRRDPPQILLRLDLYQYQMAERYEQFKVFWQQRKQIEVLLASQIVAYVWGSNRYSQLGIGETLPNTPTPTPTPIYLPDDVSPNGVAAGLKHSLAMGSNGVLYGWGDKEFGQLGQHTYYPGHEHTPVAIALPAGVEARAIAAGWYFSLAIGSDNILYAWGDNRIGEIGIGTTSWGQTTPTPVHLPSGITAAAISAQALHSLAIGSDGQVYAWGSHGLDLFPYDQSTPTLVELPSGVKAVDIAAGGNHSLAIGSDDRAYVWGYNDVGQLGIGSPSSQPEITPTCIDLPGGITAAAIAAGGNHSLAIGSDGQIYAWGANTAGQLGIGAVSTYQSTPTPIELPDGVMAEAIAAGGNHSLAVGSGGQVYAWGANTAGQLGIGTVSPYESTPTSVELPGGAIVIPTLNSIAVADEHCLAIVFTPWA